MLVGWHSETNFRAGSELRGCLTGSMSAPRGVVAHEQGLKWWAEREIFDMQA